MKTHRYRLRFLDHTHHLPQSGAFLLGRGESCHVVLDGDLVSREHARVEVTTNGVVLHDLDSMNGTYVNERRVRNGRPLEHGDRIRIAFFNLTFEVLAKNQTAPRTLQLVFCSGCKSALTSDMRFCVHCGDAVAVTKQDFGCPECGVAVSKQMKYCGNCGYDL